MALTPIPIAIVHAENLVDRQASGMNMMKYRSGVPDLLVAKIIASQVVIHQIVAERGDHAGLMVVE